MSSRYFPYALDSECGRDRIKGQRLISLLKCCNFCPGVLLNIFFKHEKIEHERKHRITGVVIDNEELFKAIWGLFPYLIFFKITNLSVGCADFQI